MLGNIKVGRFEELEGSYSVIEIFVLWEGGREGQVRTQSQIVRTQIQDTLTSAISVVQGSTKVILNSFVSKYLHNNNTRNADSVRKEYIYAHTYTATDGHMTSPLGSFSGPVPHDHTLLSP